MVKIKKGMEATIKSAKAIPKKIRAICQSVPNRKKMKTIYQSTVSRKKKVKKNRQ